MSYPFPMEVGLFFLAVSLCVPLYAVDPACKEASKFKSVLLAPPASIEQARYERCEGFDRVTFQALRPYPDESLSDLILKRWQENGWLPVLNDDNAWQSLISKDRLRVARYRKFTVQNSKGQHATLTLTYTKVLNDPILEGWPVAGLDFGDLLHVQLTAPSVR